MSADYSRYPNADDVQLLMQSTKLWPVDTNSALRAYAEAEIGAKAASDAFETIVGWYPFLAAGSATRVFDAVDQTGYLDLEGAVQSVSGYTISGTAYTVGTQYTLQPRNATARGFGYTGIQMGFGVNPYTFTAMGSIAVTGVWGRVTTVPGDVWQACLQLAGLYTLTQIENLQNIATLSIDGYSKSYDVVGVIQQKDLATMWGKDYGTLVNRYIRAVCA